MATVHKIIPKCVSQTKSNTQKNNQCSILKFPIAHDFLKTNSKTLSKPTKHVRGSTKNEEMRKFMLAKVHIAKKHLMETLPDFTDDTYRFILNEQFGLKSSANLSHSQLSTLLNHFVKLGWSAKKGRHRKQAPDELFNDTSGLNREELLKKIEAMLAEKGRIEGTKVPWGYAVSILKRKSFGKVNNFKDAKQNHLAMVIAALCKDAKRKGRRVR